ncbi:ComEC/Rec2 family competence protein [Rhizomicrobium electricum]|uniref:ComEC/Rec2 family competence protein n=1 Tax=Rhizomicrobium electricum TaxID=480070 RepID=A0ABN1ES34_9PROT|nr:ComEC/Rec2 family competence protein [Rhizomicrobium electricum]NIJ48934.1 competence protein ComEC [Rhizomicrobium electricum]
MAKILVLPRIIRDHAAAERTRAGLWIPVALATGAGSYFTLPFEPGLGWVPMAAVFAVAFGWLAAVAETTGTRIAFALIAAFVLGFGAARLRTDVVAAPILSHRMGPIHLDARVVQSEPRGNGSRLVLEPIPTARLPATKMPRRVRFTVRAHSDVPEPGSWVHVLAILMPPPSPSMPGDYDFGRWAYYQQIGAVGYLYGKPKPIPPVRPETWSERARSALEDLRTRMTEHIRAVIPGNEGVISAALITGERADIDPDDQTAFRDSGLMHVLSISGLHLALAGGVFFWVIRALFACFPRIVLKHPIKKWAAIGALLGSTFYLLISGCEAPAVRSWVMLAFMFVAILVDRPALSMRSVMLAAAAIILAAPENVLDAGCQMSFAAVIGLIAMAEWQQGRSRDEAKKTLWRKAWRYVLGICVTSTIAGLATAPISIFHFDRASPFGILANLAALPVVGAIIMPAAVAAMVLMPFGLDTWPLIAMGKGTAIMLAIARWVAALPGAGMAVPAWPGWCVALMMGGGLWIALWRRGWRWLGLIPIAAGLLFVPMVRPPDILVAQDGRTVALRLDNGRLALTQKPNDKYAAASWLRRAGDDRLPQDAIGGPGLKCDALGCIAHLKGTLIAVDARAEALAEDCANAAIVISAVAAHRICNGPRLVIDRRDAIIDGAHAVWLDTPLRVEKAEDARGLRPWSGRYQRLHRTQ